MTVAATGSCSATRGARSTGPSHLRYGFARDFMLPSLLTAIVAVALGSAACWRLLARRRSARISSRGRIRRCRVRGAGRSRRIDDGRARQRASADRGQAPRRRRLLGACAGQTCDVRVAATTTGGDRSRSRLVDLDVRLRERARAAHGLRADLGDVDVRRPAPIRARLRLADGHGPAAGQLRAARCGVRNV